MEYKKTEWQRILLTTVYVREKYAGWVPRVVPMGIQCMHLQAAVIISLSDVFFDEGPENIRQFRVR